LTNLGNTNDALGYAFKTVDLAKEIGNDMKYITIMLTIAESYYQTTEKEKGIEYGNIALSKAIEIDNSYQIGMSHYTLSLIEINTKNAIDHALKSKESWEMTGNTDMLGATHYSLGRQYSGIKKHDLAIESFKKALAITQHPSQKGILFMSIGWEYIEIKNYDEAIGFVKGGLRLFKKLDYIPGLISCYNYLGFIYIGKMNLEKAKESANLALKISEENNVDVYEYCSDAYVILAKAARFEKDYDKAKEYYDLILKIEAELLGDYYTLKVFYEDYVEFLKETGNTAECEVYEKKLMELVDE